MATPRFQFADRQAQERALRLKGYSQSDRADALAAKLGQRDEEDSARQALMQQRLEIERAANDRKTATSEGRRQIAEDNLKRLQDASATEDRIRQKKQELAEEEQKTKADRAESILNDAIGFQKDARGMDPSSPKFDQQLQNLYAGYPLAGEHPSVQNWQKYHLPLREKYVAAEIAKQEEAGKTATARAGLQQTYAKTLGHLSDLYEQQKDNPNAVLPNGEKIGSAITGAEEIIRSLESQNPGLRATRNLPGEVSNAPTSAPVVASALPAGLSAIPTTLTAQPDPLAAPISPVVTTADAPVSTLTGADAPTVVNPNLAADDSAIQPLSEVGGSNLSTDEVRRNAQAKLKELGFYYGDVNGQESPAMTAATRRFQIRTGEDVTGQLTPTTLDGLGSGPKARRDLWPPPAGTSPAETPPVAAAAPVVPQPPDLGALAQKALDDPDATDEHKAAAKRFLNKQSGQAAGAALVSAGT